VLQEKFSSQEAEILTLHQLGPELAESASRSECVIFVDAATGPGHPGEIQAKEVLSSDSHMEASTFCHAMMPSHVLALVAQLYNRCPRALSASVVGENFDHGEALSPAVEAALPALLARIEELAALR
jgi:hydrogenase maturation protease